MKLTDVQLAALQNIVATCEKEDSEHRDRQMREWRRNEQYWHGLQHIIWNELTESWVDVTDPKFLETLGDEDRARLGVFYDIVVDIFGPHGQSIIAALGAQIPGVRFIPDDADEPLDVITAQTYTKIASLIQRHNKAKLLFFQAMFYLYLNGFVAGYRSIVSKPEFGVLKRTGATTTLPLETQVPYCAECEIPLESEVCPQCDGAAEMRTETVPTEVPAADEDRYRSRVMIDVFGGLHVKLPIYARTQADFPYILLYGEHPKDLLMSQYPDYADLLESQQTDHDAQDRFADTHYKLGDSSSLLTCVRAWLRPHRFYLIQDKAIRDALLKKFPDGVQLTLVGNERIIVEVTDESLDSRWEIGKAGLSTYIHSDPICRPLVPVQDLRNSMVNLTASTIEHGIPTLWVDADVVNKDEPIDSVPGAYRFAKPRAGGSLAEAFFAEPRSTLSKDVPGFIGLLDKDGQMAVGSFPSIYGGPSQGSSRTFAEYDTSRRMALQRLSIVWSNVLDWWLRLLDGATRLYANSRVEDENFVTQEQSTWINVWIRLSQLSGRVSGVQPEGSEQFPVTSMQLRDTVLRLFEMNNPIIMEVLASPENAGVLQEALALNEIKIPGANQRLKQMLEIVDMLRPETEMAVPIDLELEDHEIHAEVCKGYLTSPIGIDLQRTNPRAYQWIREHFIAHKQVLQQEQMNDQRSNGNPGQR